MTGNKKKSAEKIERDCKANFDFGILRGNGGGVPVF